MQRIQKQMENELQGAQKYSDDLQSLQVSLFIPIGSESIKESLKVLESGRKKEVNNSIVRFFEFSADLWEGIERELYNERGPWFDGPKVIPFIYFVITPSRKELLCFGSWIKLKMLLE
jgi:hypothetical protein